MSGDHQWLAFLPGIQSSHVFTVSAASAHGLPLHATGSGHCTVGRTRQFSEVTRQCYGQKVSTRYSKKYVP